MGTRATSDKLGFNIAHKPGALTRYFAKRWLNRRGTKDEQQLIAWLLESALGRNALYFIERTKEYVDAWRGGGEVVPVDAFDGFAITGDPVEDTIIPHAVLVWTCMNDRPWPEEVYHRWLDQLLAAGSAEAAYLAASLWPAHDLMAKVTYRPPGWLIYRGQLDAEAERLILIEMLKGAYGPRTSLYGSFEHDDVRYPGKLPEYYIKRHGFTHPICGLVNPTELEWRRDLCNRIQEVLAAPSWSEGVKGAAMLLYLSLKGFNGLRMTLQEILNTLEQNLFKLDERHINIINFHMHKTEKIDYNLIKNYINYLIILYDKIIDENRLSMEIFSKYISIGLKTKDAFYIGKNIKDIIFNLMLKEKEKTELWLEKQTDDLRIKNILLSIHISRKECYLNINEELKNELVDKKIEDIYGKIKYIDKIALLINQHRIYFESFKDSYKICCFIEDILKRNGTININFNFIEDYSKIINIWYLHREHFLTKDMFLNSSHIGLYLYYSILTNWGEIIIDLRNYIDEKREFNLYTYTRNKIIKNFYTHTKDNVEERLNLYLNKIESNNLPFEEIKYKLIIKLINIIKNNYNKILEYFKDENKMKLARKVILSNIDLIEGELRDLKLFELLGIDNKSKNMIIY